MNYPLIINKTQIDHGLSLTLNISPELDVFKGHFDKFPIVPGVIQIQWALYYFNNELAPSIAQESNWSVLKISALKFQHIITPDTQLRLALSFDVAKQYLIFKASNDEHNFSSGKIFVERTE